MTAMLRINDLSVCYDGKQVLSRFSLSVSNGEVVCITGESGCGKSTLLKAVMGFVGYEGNVSVGDKVLSEYTVASVRRQIAYVPQELTFPHETVEDMVRLPFELKANRGRGFDKEKLLEEWGKLALSPALFDKKVAEVSGGQRQRMMLCVAGMLGKGLLLADEPTSALDLDSGRIVADYFRVLAKERGMAILVVSHSAEFAAMADRTVRLVGAGA